MYKGVDAHADPECLVALMDRVQSTAGIQRCRQLAREALSLRPGDSVLDLGCGTGEEVREIARHVMPGGRVVGVDLSQVMVEEARRRAPDGLPQMVDFEVGDASRLRFEDGTFDACRSERMFGHVPDPAAVLVEMVRVTRPGGRVMVIDTDMDTVLMDSVDRTLTRRFLSHLADLTCNPWIGRQLPRMFGAMPFRDVNVYPEVVQIGLEPFEPLLENELQAIEGAGQPGLEEWQEWQEWRNHLVETHQQGTLFVAMVVFVVVGTKL